MTSLLARWHLPALAAALFVAVALAPQTSVAPEAWDRTAAAAARAAPPASPSASASAAEVRPGAGLPSYAAHHGAAVASEDGAPPEEPEGQGRAPGEAPKRLRAEEPRPAPPSPALRAPPDTGPPAAAERASEAARRPISPARVCVAPRPPPSSEA